MSFNRFKVVKGSTSSHCCFESSIIDTLTGKTICECFCVEDAEAICDKLNKE